MRLSLKLINKRFILCIGMSKAVESALFALLDKRPSDPFSFLATQYVGYLFLLQYLRLAAIHWAFSWRPYSFAEQRDAQGSLLRDVTVSSGESENASPVSSRILRAASLVNTAGIRSHSFGARVEQAYQLLSMPELGSTLFSFYSSLYFNYYFAFTNSFYTW